MFPPSSSRRVRGVWRLVAVAYHPAPGPPPLLTCRPRVCSQPPRSRVRAARPPRSVRLSSRSLHMTTPIRVGIVGYGNLGRGAEVALTRCPDMQLVGIFSRRDPSTVKPLNPEVPVHLLSALDGMRDTIDVLLLCGGSKSDLPEQAPKLARHFNTVDSYDTHNRIPGYFEAVNTAAREGDRLAVISVGWDPGLFSLYRLFGEAVLPEGETYTFWGKGLSQGHSDAVRRVPGVKAGVQYTLPSEAAMERARSGSLPTLTTREKHTRECHVVLEVGADP